MVSFIYKGFITVSGYQILLTKFCLTAKADLEDICPHGALLGDQTLEQ